MVIGSKKMSDRNDETKGNEEIIFHHVFCRSINSDGYGSRLIEIRYFFSSFFSSFRWIKH